MPVAGGPKITKTGILLEVDAANASSYASGSSTWVNVFNPGTRNGTINGTVGFNQDDSKGALTFPGTSSAYVDFGNIGDLSVSWSFQVAVKPAPSASGNYTILSYASGSDTGSITYKLDYSSSNQSAVLSVYSATGSTQIVHQVTGSVPTGSWSIINASYGNSVVGMYVNGAPTDYVLTTGSTAGYNANNRLYLGGTFGITSSFYTGSMASFFSYNTDVPNIQLVQNYNAYATRFGLPPSILAPVASDPDALKFITIAEITNATQVAAINGLVTGLKSNNLWDKMQAIYPFVGGTAFSHKFNLKDPRDLDAAFRLQYFGTVIHSNLGISGSGYANTYYFPLTSNTNASTSMHLSMYSTSPNSETFPGTVVGNVGNASGLHITPNYRNAGISYYQLYFAGFGGWLPLGGAGSADVGFYLASRTSLNDVAFYRRINTGNTSTSATAPYLAGTNNFVRILSAAFVQWTGNIGFSTLGYGLSAADAENLDTVVTAYQTTLGRKPF
jgi:hypothetical protein